MRSLTALALATILALTAPITSAHADEATAAALQAWYAGTGPLPDLIAVQDGLNQVIGAPLTAAEIETVRQALWRRQADLIRTDFERGGPNSVLRQPSIFMQMAFTHLLDGGALRAGDFTALHGALLTGMQPNTFALAQKWEGLMKCIGITAKKAPACVGY